MNLFANLFSKYSFKQKIAIMASILLLMFITPSYFTFTYGWQRLDLISHEQKALQLVEPLQNLIILLQNERGLHEMERFSSQKSISTSLEKVHQQINNLFYTLLDNKNEYKKVSIDIESLYKNWKNNHLDFASYTKFIEELIESIKKIALVYNVFQDQELKNHYLIFSLFDTLPNIEESIARIRGILSANLAADKKEISRQVDEQIVILNAESKTLDLALHHYFTFTYNPALQKKYTQLQKDIFRFITYSKNISLKNIIPIDYFNYASSLIHKCKKFSQVLIQEFQHSLSLQKKKIIVTIIALITALLSIALLVLLFFWGFYLSIEKPLEKIKEYLTYIIQGDYSHTLTIKTKDEMHEIASAFNTMQKSLQNSMSFLQSYQRALDSAAYVIKMDKNGNITYVNQAFLKATGYSPKEIIGKNYTSFYDPSNPSHLEDDIRNTIKTKRVWKGIVSIKTKQSTTIITNTTITPILDKEGEIQEFITVLIDITELVKAKEKIQKLFYYDTLTKLPNRNSLLQDAQKKEPTALVLLNIDNFRAINDVYGYNAGNFVLQQSAHLLHQCERNLCKLYRLHADEFCLVSYAHITKEQLFACAQSAIERVEAYTFIYEGTEIKITLKAGVALLKPKMGIENILIDAEAALKEAKTRYEKIIYYEESESKKEEYKRNFEWIRRIRSAIDDRRIVPYFQPIVNNKTKKAEKYEVLMRLQGEDGRVYSPFYFLDIAKRTRLYTSLTKIMIEKSLDIFKNRPEQLSINLSTQDIASKEIRTFITQKIAHFKKERIVFESSERSFSNIVIEITESEEIENYDLITEFIQEISKYQTQIAIDDFGSGYSNFVYILNMGVSFLKIDGSLIKNILEDEKSQTLVKGIVHFSRELGIKTIAEFVENEAIFHKVCALGIDYSQGYYFSAPIPASKLPST